MEENLSETGVDLGNAENVVEELIPDDEKLIENSSDLQTDVKIVVDEKEVNDSSVEMSDEKLLKEDNDKNKNT